MQSSCLASAVLHVYDVPPFTGVSGQLCCRYILGFVRQVFAPQSKGAQTTVLFAAGDRPYLVSGADDKLAKVWDYQTKACVQTLDGHSHNVSAVCFHPELPVILTGLSFHHSDKRGVL